MILYRTWNFIKRISLENNSFCSSLADCTSSCGWCIHHCPDEDKYDILVLCIRLQKEFINIWKNINSMLPGRTDTIEKNLLGVFSGLAETEHRTAERVKRILFSKKISENEWQLPGCSQIFLLANVLEKTYSGGISEKD